jgi:hypothetical protein
VKRVLWQGQKYSVPMVLPHHEELDELFALSSLFLDLPLAPKTAIIGSHLFIDCDLIYLHCSSNQASRFGF